MESRDKPRMTGGSHPLPFEKLAPLEFERLMSTRELALLSQRNLIRKRILRFNIQFDRVGVDDRQIRGIFSDARPGEIGADCLGDEVVTVGWVRRPSIECFRDVFR